VKIGAFELDEPIPELRNPYAFAILRPWIDVNHVGTLVLRDLEIQFGAKALGKLARPGHFFDFTRYRPSLRLEGGVRHVNVPNVFISYARRETGNDFLFLNLLEPHASSEVYVDSVLRLFKTLGVKKYCLLGSMYDVVPHTRPLTVYGGALGRETPLDLEKSDVRPSNYQGPTTITILITQKAPALEIDTIWFIVSLPQYVRLEEDFLGKVRLMEVLNSLYHIRIDKKDYQRAEEQLKTITQRVEQTPELKDLVPQLETLYDLRMKGKEGERPRLSPEMEEILWRIMGKDVGEA
jgi:predicted ATP-grasp superfamily ATP-dependent carboligase